ncbi:hypothetical protein [Pseudonocardia sp.]|uniref:hypothetical protein n=1 Tax=Pseudonocardia sp. TaxID=60912 RepID=UPI003D0C9AD0
MVDTLHRGATAEPVAADRRPEWALVIPRQDVVVRLNGHAPDASPLDYLPAVRPYGVTPMARALRLELPGLGLLDALRTALRAHRGVRAVAAFGPRADLDEARARLLVGHALVSFVEPEPGASGS